MIKKDLILNLPFDENDGSATAYDYSPNRFNADVCGNAHFVAGRNGNAIEFDGHSTCEIGSTIINNAMSFTVLAYVRNGIAEMNSPKKLIWLINFDGVNNYEEVTIDAKPGEWYSLAFVRDGSTLKFYVGGELVETRTNDGKFLGFSLNQDYYLTIGGFGALDDVEIFKRALTREEIYEELSQRKKQTYLLDGVDFKTYGVYVSASKGVVNRPKLKSMAAVSWDNYHGEVVDLQHKFYEPRTITLSCFIKAESKTEFIQKISKFEQQFDKLGTQRLVIDVHPTKPLIYEVYCKDEISINKTWDDRLMVGTFDLKLTEPEPVKRVLRITALNLSTSVCEIRMTTQKLVNIYWGDGEADFDVSGTNKLITHTYKEYDEYYPVITGCIDEITDFTTNAIIIWNKL